MPSQQMLHQQAVIPKITPATIKKLRVSQLRLKTQRSEQSSKRLCGFFRYRRVCVRVSTNSPLNSDRRPLLHAG